ncbi:lysylphosphatidylglycerol synthase domain-containing protein, partial [Arthrospira platensis SPKY1]|nr:lysylphosphatidylglycerol synthase domain-containing protein [Arthrospira platensis SPKY1]
SEFRLFTAVLNMYAVNYAFPRLGEISRAYYLSKREKIPVSNLLGTVVLERVVDTFTLGFLVGISFLAIWSKPHLVRGLLGDDLTDLLQGFSLAEQWPWVLIMVLGAFGALLGLMKLMQWFRNQEIRRPWVRKGQAFLL